MRTLLAAILVLTAAPTSTAIGEPQQGLRASADEQQQSKLGVWVGVWRCTQVQGGAAEKSATRLQGSYYVTRYTGAQSLTAYTRWDPGDKAYHVVRILDAGGIQVFVSSSPDPANGTWVGVFPEKVKGRSIETTLHGDQMTWGDMKTYGINCRKRAATNTSR